MYDNGYETKDMNHLLRGGLNLHVYLHIEQLASSHIFELSTVFLWIVAHALISALPQISAQPLGYNIKQVQSSNKCPPPLPVTFLRINSRDTKEMQRSAYHWWGRTRGWWDDRYYEPLYTYASLCFNT